MIRGLKKELHALNDFPFFAFTFSSINYREFRYSDD